MTTDKIKYYIGQEILNFYNSLNIEQLKECKRKLIYEFNNGVKLPNEIMFKYTIELEYINILLR